MDKFLHNSVSHIHLLGEQKLRRWVKHFSQLPSCPPIESICVTSGNVEQNEFDLEPPEELETTSAIQKFKRKSLGENVIPLEVFKSRLLALLSPLTVLFRRIWDSRKIEKPRFYTFYRRRAIRLRVRTTELSASSTQQINSLQPLR